MHPTWFWRMHSTEYTIWNIVLGAYSGDYVRNWSTQTMGTKLFDLPEPLSFLIWKMDNEIKRASCHAKWSACFLNLCNPGRPVVMVVHRLGDSNPGHFYCPLLCMIARKNRSNRKYLAPIPDVEWMAAAVITNYEDCQYWQYSHC